MKHIINNFTPLGGGHCITNAMRQIFTYYGKPMSEAMIFGLSGGLGWFYMESAVSQFPMVDGRTKLELTNQYLSENLNIGINVKTSNSPDNAYNRLKEQIAQDIPVLLFVDMAYLKYLNLSKYAHFGLHAIVVFGIDEENGVAYISDRDYKNAPADRGVPVSEKADYHIVPLEELAAGRSSTYKPFPPIHKYIEFDLTNICNITKEIIDKATAISVHNMLHEKSSNLGISGMRKWAKMIHAWSRLDRKKLVSFAKQTYLKIDDAGGSGGGAFRVLFTKYLKECGELINSVEYTKFGAAFEPLGDAWRHIGDLLWDLHETADPQLLEVISNEITKAADIEEKVLIEIEKYLNSANV